MSDETTIILAVEEILPVLDGEPDLVKRLELAMRKAQRFWLSTNDQVRFTAALEAVAMTSTKAEKERIILSAMLLREFMKTTRGVGGDIPAELRGDDCEAIPLGLMWLDAKAAAR